MFYLTTHSTHFIYGYMASDIWLRTILIVRKETRCRHIGYSYRLTARLLLYAPSHRQDNTYHGLCYSSRGTLAGTRNSSMGPPWPNSGGSLLARNEMNLHGSVRWWCDGYSDRSPPPPHGHTLSNFPFQPVLHDWRNKGRVMCYPVCGTVHNKINLAANRKE